MTRTHFRRRVLESDYCIQQAVDIISQVHEGELPFDRTMKISTAENLSKDTISDRMRANLNTLKKIIVINKNDWIRAAVPRKTKPPAARPCAACGAAAAGPPRCLRNFRCGQARFSR